MHTEANPPRSPLPASAAIQCPAAGVALPVTRGAAVLASAEAGYRATCTLHAARAWSEGAATHTSTSNLCVEVCVEVCSIMMTTATHPPPSRHAVLCKHNTHKHTHKHHRTAPRLPPPPAAPAASSKRNQSPGSLPCIASTPAYAPHPATTCPGPPGSWRRST